MVILHSSGTHKCNPQPVPTRSNKIRKMFLRWESQLVCDCITLQPSFSSPYSLKRVRFKHVPPALPLMKFGLFSTSNLLFGDFVLGPKCPAITCFWMQYTSSCPYSRTVSKYTPVSTISTLLVRSAELLCLYWKVSLTLQLSVGLYLFGVSVSWTVSTRSQE